MPQENVPLQYPRECWYSNSVCDSSSGQGKQLQLFCEMLCICHTSSKGHSNSVKSNNDLKKMLLVSLFSFHSSQRTRTLLGAGKRRQTTARWHHKLSPCSFPSLTPQAHRRPAPARAVARAAAAGLHPAARYCWHGPCMPGDWLRRTTPPLPGGFIIESGILKSPILLYTYFSLQFCQCSLHISLYSGI